MIGMVLVTHGQVGKALADALHDIVGPQTQIEAIAIGPSDPVDACRDAVLGAARRVNTGQGVIVLTDMFGGTPSNLAISSMPLTQAVVLAGVNLPMLVKLAAIRASMPLAEAAREAETAGRKYIQLIADTLAPAR
jgi:PTS system mannose-specific IIA component